MSYIAITLNHFRALQEWALAHEADARLDMKTFEVEVRRNQGRCVLHPQFLSTANGTLSYTQALGPGVTGFIGWLPYRPIRWSMSTDKLEFKRFVQACRMRTPKTWLDSEVPDLDHVLKRPVGSFGQAVFGPYRAGTDTSVVPDLANRGAERMFAEQFIAGRNVKAWFWGGVPFHLHLHPYPTVRGDGVSTTEELIARRAGRHDRSIPRDADRNWILSSLAYQGWLPSDVVPKGREVWIDYRYGRRYAADPVQVHSDNMLSQLSAAAARQTWETGAKLHEELVKTFRLPVLFALDGVLDEDDRIWWLEANSNPILPPTGYPLVLATLFESASESHVQAPLMEMATA